MCLLRSPVIILICFRRFARKLRQIGNKLSKAVSNKLSNFRRKKMNIKSNLKHIWLAIAVFSMILTIFLWFGYDSQNLQYTILALTGLMLILSLPCSLFVIPVIVLANHYLAINPVSIEGIYLNTI